MAELKRHKDVPKERFLGARPHRTMHQPGRLGPELAPSTKRCG